MQTERASVILNYKPGTFDNICFLYYVNNVYSRHLYVNSLFASKINLQVILLWDMIEQTVRISWKMAYTSLVRSLQISGCRLFLCYTFVFCLLFCTYIRLLFFSIQLFYTCHFAAFSSWICCINFAHWWWPYNELISSYLCKFIRQKLTVWFMYKLMNKNKYGIQFKRITTILQAINLGQAYT